MKSYISTIFLTLLSFLAIAQNNTRPNVFLPAATGMQVNSYSGSLYLERQDLFVPGRGLDIDFTFSYNSSLDTFDWGYGHGWTYPYNMNYSLTADTIRVLKADGRRDIYIKNGSTFQPMAGNFDVFTEYQTGKYLLRTKSGMRYFFDDAASRKLSKMEDRNGNAIALTWAGDQLTSLTDASGRQLSFSWSNGHLTAITDALDTPARTWTYTYDQGYLSSVTDPLGGQWLYAYDEQHNLIRTTDQNNNETTIEYQTNGVVKAVATCLSRYNFTYNLDQGKSIVTELVGDGTQTTTYEFDAQGRNIARKGNCCGFQTTFQYDNSNNITQSTDANGNTVSYTFDTNGNATQVNDAEGCSIQMQFDPTYNQSTSFTDKNGNATTFTYNSKGNLTAVSRPLGVSESYGYDAFGNQTSHTDARGNTTNYVYNANGYLTQINHPISGLTTQFTYDNRGNKLSQTDGNGHTTTYTYDALNRPTAMQDPLGNSTTYEYDARSNKTKETNALGHTNEYKYDQLDRLIEIKAPLNTVTKYVYDSRSNLIAQTDPRGSTTTYTYDSRNFMESQTDPMGHTTSYTYDGLGNQISVTDPNGNSTQYFYDKLNRLVRTQDAMGFQTVYAYDCNGNPTSVTDANGNATSYAYDALNRQVSMTDALGFTTHFEYDKNNNLTKITDAKGNPTSYEYDALNRKSKETFADNTTKVFTYDGAGNVASRKDNAGNMTYYTYDANNRLTLRDYPDTNDDHFNYDPLGRMTEATNQNAVVTFTYDALNRMLGETLNGKTTGYAYNTATGKRTLIYPSGRVIEEYYDIRNQLADIKESGESLASFAYDPAGRMTTRSYGNGTVTTYAYDANNRVTDIVANPNEFINFHYEYDNVGNKLFEEKKHHPTHSEQYGYDAKYQLTSFKVGTMTGGQVGTPNTQTTYNYDGLGNRTTVVKDGLVTSYEVNNRNQYTALSGSQNTVYDNSPIGYFNANGTQFFEYSFSERLVKIDAGSDSLEIKYDPIGRVFQEISNGNFVEFLYSGNSIIEELDISTNNLTSNVFGLFVDDIILSTHQNQIHFFIKNGNFSNVCATNSIGIVEEHYNYDAFGKPSFSNSNFSAVASSTISNKYLFTGQRFNHKFEFYNYKTRYYDNEDGRFLKTDDIGYLGGINPFVYVNNNTPNKVDPLGYYSMSVWELIQLAQKQGFSLMVNKKNLLSAIEKRAVRNSSSFFQSGCNGFSGETSCRICCSATSAARSAYDLLKTHTKVAETVTFCTAFNAGLGGFLTPVCLYLGTVSLCDIFSSSINLYQSFDSARACSQSCGNKCRPPTTNNTSENNSNSFTNEISIANTICNVLKFPQSPWDSILNMIQ